MGEGTQRRVKNQPPPAPSPENDQRRTSAAAMGQATAIGGLGPLVDVKKSSTAFVAFRVGTAFLRIVLRKYKPAGQSGRRLKKVGHFA